MEHLLDKYTRQFSKLKRAYQHGGAPHKPILFLAILSLVESGQIQSNRIFITPELIMSFRELWSKLVNTPHQMNFALPFFHLRSEPFWKLVTKPGTFLSLTSSHSVKSLGSLNESIQYAELDADLFILMKDSEINAVLTKQILQQYFAVNIIVPLDYTELHSIEKQILNDDQYTYKARIESIETTKIGSKEKKNCLFEVAYSNVKYQRFIITHVQFQECMLQPVQMPNWWMRVTSYHSQFPKTIQSPMDYHCAPICTVHLTADLSPLMIVTKCGFQHLSQKRTPLFP